MKQDGPLGRRSTSGSSGFGEQDSKERPTERLKKAAANLSEWLDFPAPWRREIFERTAIIDQIVAHLIDFAELADRVSDRRSDRLYLNVRPALLVARATGEPARPVLMRI